MQKAGFFGRMTKVDSFLFPLASLIFLSKNQRLCKSSYMAQNMLSFG